MAPTELGCVENVLVEDDCAGAERDPCRDVDGRVERGGLRRRFERLGVHRWQHRFGWVAGSIGRGPGLLFSRHGGVAMRGAAVKSCVCARTRAEGGVKKGATK